MVLSGLVLSCKLLGAPVISAENKHAHRDTSLVQGPPCVSSQATNYTVFLLLRLWIFSPWCVIMDGKWKNLVPFSPSDLIAAFLRHQKHSSLSFHIDIYCAVQWIYNGCYQLALEHGRQEIYCSKWHECKGSIEVPRPEQCLITLEKMKIPISWHLHDFTKARSLRGANMTVPLLNFSW